MARVHYSVQVHLSVVVSQVQCEFVFDCCSNAIAAESALDRLACALGGKTMLPHIVATISSMLGHGQSP